MKKFNTKKFSFDILILTIGCLIGTFSSIAIMIPNGLTSGGVTGIARIVQRFVNLPFSWLYYSGALIVLCLCFIILGRKEAQKILLMSVLYPAALLFWEHMDVQLIQGTDMLLATIYCGVFGGLCSGIILSRGYSSGGSDTIAKMIHAKLLPNVPLSKVLLGVDASIIITSAFVYGRNVALYALVTSVIASKVIDFYMYGITPKIVQVEIITTQADALSAFILEEIGRGVSRESVTGAYTNIKRSKLVTLCSPRESVVIRQHVGTIDSHAFITVQAVNEVWGQGFKTNEDETNNQ